MLQERAMLESLLTIQHHGSTISYIKCYLVAVCNLQSLKIIPKPTRKESISLKQFKKERHLVSILSCNNPITSQYLVQKDSQDRTK